VRKQNPNDVVTAFRSEVLSIQNEWGAIRTAIGTTAGPLAKRATTDAFTRVAVTFEAFRSDWHIAAINRDSGAFQAALTADAVALVKAGSYPTLASRVQVDLPLHPPLDLIRELLAARGDHLSIRNYDHWKTRAKSQLTDPWKAQLLGMHNADRAVLNAVIAIRNVLAHNSTRASDFMHSTLGRFQAPDRPLARGARKISPSGVPAYLNAVTSGGQTRFERYVSRLDDVAARLIVP
jgi:hypothetical protein